MKRQIPWHALTNAMRRAGLAAALSAAAAAGWAVPASANCIEGTADTLVVELLFGRNIGDRLGVSERAFRRFVDREVTPRFPNGFTLMDTYGQFRWSSSRPIVREPGKYLVIALNDEPRQLPQVQAIVAAYKTQFRQDSVGILTRRACSSLSDRGN
jgi:hypothetical protein